MQTFILKDVGLNDNVLLMPDEGKIFKGNYIAIIEEYTYLNCWSNKKHVKRFRSEEALNKYLNKNYKDFQF